MMTKGLKLIKLLFSLSIFVCAFFAVLELTYFLSFSFPKQGLTIKGDPWLQTARVLFENMILLSLFIIQHSAMATEKFKNLIINLGLKDMNRSIYVSATVAVLLLITRYWQTTIHVVLWDLDLNYKPLFFIYISIHATAWTIIYVANVCTDFPELLGLKQVYYSLRNLPDPIQRKSYKLQRLLSHMRHPSFLGFLLVFWFFPLMTLDRLLLAIILTLYMYIAWNTDNEDYHYQKDMYERKYHELQRLNSPDGRKIL